MNDEQLTKELEKALAVEPTPQFLARMRRQMESESRRPALRFAWPGVSAVAAGAVVFGTMLSPEKLSTPPPTTAYRIETPAAGVEIAPAFVPPTAAVLKVAPAPVDRPQAEPDVLIDPRETAALQDFLQSVQERKIDPAGLLALFESAEKVRTTSIEPMPIAATAPIVITPLSSAAPEIGGDL